MNKYELILKDSEPDDGKHKIVISKAHGSIVLSVHSQQPLDSYGIEWQDTNESVIMSRSEAGVLLSALVDMLYPQGRDL